MTSSMFEAATVRNRRPLMARPQSSTVDLVPGGEFTVGVEEELFLLDEAGCLAPEAGRMLVDVLSAQAAALPGRVSCELFAAQIEFATSVCLDAGQIVPQLHALRAALVAGGGRPLSAGLHPVAPFADASLTDAERYRLIGDTLAGLLRTPTAALQVHVGLPDERAAMLAYRGMRHQLAVLQALAANSPFWHGRDSGMASARWAVISSYPRGGVPPVVRSWDEYASLIDAVQTAAEVPDYTHVWWDARLQPRLGTIEVRVMDAQPSLGATAGLAALTQGLVRYAVENPLDVDVPSAVLAENSFRVARHGLETRVVDVDGSLHPVRDLATRMVGKARAALRLDGLDEALDGVERLLACETSYARQRRLRDDHGMTAVLDDLVERTAVG